MARGYEARDVVAKRWGGYASSLKATIEFVDDGRQTGIRAKPPLDGEHFGWDLPKLDQAKLQLPSLAQRVRVCANKQGDRSHRGTVACRPTEFIMLDVGYWGHFDRAKPQRDFGLIEGTHVWQCRLVSSGVSQANADARAKIKKENAALATKLVDKLEARGYGIQLVTHASAANTPGTDQLPKDRLTVLFPDMHLPEKFPNMPPSAKRHPSKEARDRLRRDLRASQHTPAWWASVDGIRDDLVSRKDQLRILDHLSRVLNGDRVDWKTVIVLSTKKKSTRVGRGTVTVNVPDKTRTHTFTAEQFLAEKDVLDRELQVKSCWFYPPRGGNRASDPAPAIDLVSLLGAIRELHEEKSKVEVIQVGDLLELWMNREYLYREFPVCKSGASSKFQAWLIRKLGSKLGKVSGYDLYQYRFDDHWGFPKSKRETWVDDISSRDVRCYVFNNWPAKWMVDRYTISPSLKSGSPEGQALARQGALKRMARLVDERVSNIRDFSLPMPGTPQARSLANHESQLLKPLEKYTIQNAQGDREVLWNRLVLDMLAYVGCKMVYGNHDGYRGDPMANGLLTPGERAKPWHSEPGLWVEHGHRWDEYNRDGMAIGAGVTNLVYYYYYPHIQRLDELKEQILPSLAHKALIPGAATWFLLVNYGPRQSWFGQEVQPFGVYAYGHTHSPDLYRVKIQNYSFH